jgi:hypothetical protein
MLATTAALTVFLAIAGPITALIIERQRDRLRELVVEKNNLIDRYAVETRRATSEISQLNGRIDAWEGRANPWDFWPPNRDEPPRKNLVANLNDHSQAVLANSLRNGSFDLLQSARGNIAFAILADAVGHGSEAQLYYELARDQLVTLCKQNPNEPRFAKALAELYSQLARLTATKDRKLAAANLEHAAAIYKKLAAEHDKDPTHSIALLETELYSATIAGFTAGQTHLARVAELNEMLFDKWPSDPEAVYRLACYLTQHEAILSQVPGKPEPSDVPELQSRVTAPTD